MGLGLKGRWWMVGGGLDFDFVVDFGGYGFAMDLVSVVLVFQWVGFWWLWF